MQELNVVEIDDVSGGLGLKVILEAVASSVVYDVLKGGFTYAMQNSHMGRGNFPPVHRAGRE